MTALAVHRSRKLIPDFALLRPRSVEEAVAMQAAGGVGAVLMAGGIDVTNRMKAGAPVTQVIHLGGVPGLDFIAAEGDGIRIGALVTHHALERSPLLRARLPVLAETWWSVGNIRIRAKGTVGGNLKAREPHYDFAPAVMAAGGRLSFARPGGALETVAALELTNAAGHPRAQPGLLTAITLPALSGLRLALDRSLRPGLTLALGLDLADGKVVAARAGIGCAYVAPHGVTLPLDAPLTPAALAAAAPALAARVVDALPEPVADHNGSAAWRRRMVGVLLRRNLIALANA